MAAPKVRDGVEISGSTATRPTATAEPGDTFWDSTLGELLVFDGGDWQPAAGAAGGFNLGVTDWDVSSQVADLITVSFTLINAAGPVTTQPIVYIYFAGNDEGLIIGQTGTSATGACTVVEGANPLPDIALGLGWVSPSASGVFTMTIEKNVAASYWLVVRLPGQPLAISPEIVFM